MEFDHHYVSTLQTFMNQKVQVIYEKKSDTICVFFCERFLIKVIHSSSPPNPPTSDTPQSLPTSSICRAASRSDHVAKMPSWGSKMSSCKAWLKLSSVCGLRFANSTTRPLEPWFYMMYLWATCLGKREHMEPNKIRIFVETDFQRMRKVISVSSYKWLEF